jgi:hypothetical protein
MLDVLSQFTPLHRDVIPIVVQYAFENRFIIWRILVVARQEFQQSPDSFCVSSSEVCVSSTQAPGIIVFRNTAPISGHAIHPNSEQF